MGLLDQIKKNKELQTTKKDKFYKIGERVELIIYEETIPNKALERLKDLKTLHGDNYIYPIKDSGIAYKCAVIRRNLDENYENGEYLFNDTNKLPSIPIVTKIEFMPPDDIKWDKFAFLYRKGIGYNVYDNIPELIYLFPGILNDHTNDKFKDAINKEWDVLIKEYANATEEEAKVYLQDRLARRYGIAFIDPNKDNEIVILTPKVGVTFTSTITHINYPFFTINSVIYNKNTKKTEIKTGLNAQYNKATIKLAETVKNLIEKNKNNKRSKKDEDLEELLEDMF